MRVWREVVDEGPSMQVAATAVSMISPSVEAVVAALRGPGRQRGSRGSDMAQEEAVAELCRWEVLGPPRWPRRAAVLGC